MMENALSILIVIFSVQLQQTEISERKLFIFHLGFFPYSRLSSYHLHLFFWSYFVLAVPMRECLGKHLCMSSPCPIAILNGTFLFREVK